MVSLTLYAKEKDCERVATLNKGVFIRPFHPHGSSPPHGFRSAYDFVRPFSILRDAVCMR